MKFREMDIKCMTWFYVYYLKQKCKFCNINLFEDIKEPVEIVC